MNDVKGLEVLQSHEDVKQQDYQVVVPLGVGAQFFEAILRIFLAKLEKNVNRVFFSPPSVHAGEPF